MLDEKKYRAAQDIWRAAAILCGEKDHCLIRKTGEIVDGQRAVQHMLSLARKQGMSTDGTERRAGEPWSRYVNRVAMKVVWEMDT